MRRYRTDCIPRQRGNYSGKTYRVHEDFPKRLRRFQERSGLSWSEIARLLGTYRNTVWCWRGGKARPSYQYFRALIELADGMGLGNLFVD